MERHLVEENDNYDYEYVDVEFHVTPQSFDKKLNSIRNEKENVIQKKPTSEKFEEKNENSISNLKENIESNTQDVQTKINPLKIIFDKKKELANTDKQNDNINGKEIKKVHIVEPNMQSNKNNQDIKKQNNVPIPIQSSKLENKSSNNEFQGNKSKDITANQTSNSSDNFFKISELENENNNNIPSNNYNKSIYSLNNNNYQNKFKFFSNRDNYNYIKKYWN